MISLLKKGYFRASDYLLKNWFLTKGIDIGEKLRYGVNSIKSDLEKLVQLVSSAKKYHTVIPVVKWGQSEGLIKLHIKFSHRFDTPGCLELRDEKLEILNGQDFTYEAKCLQGSQPLLFKLSFK